MRTPLLMLLALALTAATPPPAGAGCGCDKPPPPRAQVRPFVGHVDQTITLFDDRFQAGQRYDVLFESTVGASADWSRGKGLVARDFADAQPRPQLKVRVADVGLGPCRITVYRQGALMLQLADDQFTVAGRPLVLHDFRESISRSNYRAAVGRDGTLYIPVDVAQVNSGTTFTGNALGFPLTFAASDVAIYNDQGFLMQLLDPKIPGLFAIDAGTDQTSNTLTYWRHEFQTYKAAHRQVDAWAPDDNDPDWHANGTYHVDHDHVVVAIRGTLADGSTPAPGATAPFKLVIRSVGSDQ